MRKILAYTLLFALVCSCKFVSGFLNGDQQVARVGDEILYVAQVEEYIPDYVVGDDSLRIARQYVNSWAIDHLFMKLAKEQLSEEEMDVSEQLEQYRRALIRYRYEQLYVNERLDTLITEDQINDYYDAHREDFVIRRPILKFRYVDVVKDSPYAEDLVAIISAKQSDILDGEDSLAIGSALTFIDRSETWTDVTELAREFGVDYALLLQMRKGNVIKYEPANTKELRQAFLLEVMENGYAPVEFCTASIRDIILSGRKHDLLSTLEQDLLENALDKKTFEIYR